MVIGGLSRSDYARLAPPRSFLHVDDFDSPRDLADMVLFLDTHPEHMIKFHKWCGLKSTRGAENNEMIH